MSDLAGGENKCKAFLDISYQGDTNLTRMFTSYPMGADHVIGSARYILRGKRCIMSEIANIHLPHTDARL